MKKNQILFLLCIVAFAGLLWTLQRNVKRDLNVKKVSTGNTRTFLSDKLNAVPPKTKHAQDVLSIQNAAELERKGDAFFKAGLFSEALISYQKAYTLDKGSRAVSGFLLAQTYEKLKRFDDAINQLNQMIQNGELSELGIQDAQEMISRLLVAKEHAGKVE